MRQLVNLGQHGELARLHLRRPWQKVIDGDDRTDNRLVAGGQILFADGRADGLRLGPRIGQDDRRRRPTSEERLHTGVERLVVRGGIQSRVEFAEVILKWRIHKVQKATPAHERDQAGHQRDAAGVLGKDRPQEGEADRRPHRLAS